jgi:hypothetical protein
MLNLEANFIMHDNKIYVGISFSYEARKSGYPGLILSCNFFDWKVRG